jgi:hypothetical protein
VTLARPPEAKASAKDVFIIVALLLLLLRRRREPM